ncbi:MAG: sugar ABC transporter ATP-binding protein [Oscillospiraceae bacterium]|jgi:rhamnose transport system ATP-binding protein|nr:sugar ABC transporter ATP-binding protein [Oscillospiraceae bacterium]
MSDKLLSMNRITKIFPGVKALSDVRFDLNKGEIHALVGENGAGKSTFIKVLAGVHQPDSGEILLDGAQIIMKDPTTAQKHGIAAIHQHAASYPDLSVAENIFIGHEFMIGPFVNWRKTNSEAKKLLDSIGADIQPQDIVGSLSVARQQLVEIVKALSQNARILIMDEPTAALSKQESEELYAIAKNLRNRGVAIILISHRFEDIFDLADRATVLRDGGYVGTWSIDEIDTNKLVAAMVGRDIGHFFPKKQTQPGDELLRIENLSRTGFFRDVSLSVRAGEIVALTGLVGAGRTEVAETVFGAEQASAGQIYIEGKPVQIHSPNEAMSLGVGLLPEDRQLQGLLMNWSIERNITLPTLKQCARGAFVSSAKEYAMADNLKTRLNIKANDVKTNAEALSGGNQQKVVVAKQLAVQPKILILDEPTKGVDVGSKAAIYEIMSNLAAQGMGILMVSSEMPEVINMADRIYVMREGRISAHFSAKGITQNQILEAAVPLAKAARNTAEREVAS